MNLLTRLVRELVREFSKIFYGRVSYLAGGGVDRRVGARLLILLLTILLALVLNLDVCNVAVAQGMLFCAMMMTLT